MREERKKRYLNGQAREEHFHNFKRLGVSVGRRLGGLAQNSYGFLTAQDLISAEQEMNKTLKEIKDNFDLMIEDVLEYKKLNK